MRVAPGDAYHMQARAIVKSKLSTSFAGLSNTHREMNCTRGRHFMVSALSVTWMRLLIETPKSFAHATECSFVSAKRSMSDTGSRVMHDRMYLPARTRCGARAHRRSY